MTSTRARCPICGQDLTGYAGSSQWMHHDMHGPIEKLKHWLRRRR